MMGARDPDLPLLAGPGRQAGLFGALLVMALVLPFPVSAGGLVIKGVIVNWGQVQRKVPDQAYFQLVKVQEKMGGRTDSQGLASLTSDLPVIPVSRRGSFKVNLGQLPPGDYLIALQRALPAAPILVREGKPAIIRVPGKFPLDLGRLQVEIR